MRWHAQSEYADAGHFRRLDRNGRRIWRARAHEARRNGRITADTEAVAAALLRHHAENGRCDPSHATIAAFAGCCERTVRRALGRLAACGLVAWTRRIIRTTAGARQTSSAYRLMIAGAESIARLPRPDRRRRRHVPQGSHRMEKPTHRSDIEGAATMLDELKPARSLAEIAQAGQQQHNAALAARFDQRARISAQEALAIRRQQIAARLQNRKATT